MAKFYRCKGCGNFISIIGEKSACTPKCCGEEMTELKANTTDGAAEKHVPDVTIDGDKVCVQVGSVAHPMLEEHHIAFIYLETEDSGQIQYLKPGEEPKAEFLLNGKKAIRVYEYCNLHGLWVKEL
ncbi:superoxide reductase [Lachnospiraceae bacterium KH1T2]|nr:superoxide reductase [Lachnospiraceae bacterium KH1T2]